MTQAQENILRHALGIGRGGHRNHFVTGPGCDDYADCEALTAAGLMTKTAGTALTGWDNCYSVTEAGRTALEKK